MESDGERLETSMSAQFFENVLDMIADRCRADAEMIRDTPRILAPGEQAQHVSLPFAQRERRWDFNGGVGLNICGMNRDDLGDRLICRNAQSRV